MWELILDEASQIPGFCTFSILHTFPDLQKLVIVGDPKQLRPYGSQDTRGISSAFDVFEAHQEPIFLDVQFRMPKPIADILSRLAYNGRLKTAEEKAAGPSCIQWVDVPAGKEKQEGTSKTNEAEMQAIVRLFQTGELKEFSTETAVLSFYKKQATRIKKALDDAKIPASSDTVDSFQGREAAIVVLSLVLTEPISKTFLADARRVLAGLSRAQRVIYLVGKKSLWDRANQVPLLREFAKQAV